MPQLKLSRHPIRLMGVYFPELQFKRTRNVKPPFAFPAFIIDADIVTDLEKRTLRAELRVASAKREAQKATATKPVASFSLVSIAHFTCAEFDDSSRAISEFAASASPYQLMWPYVRTALAQIVTVSGLPPYHLPLVLAWNQQEAQMRAEVDAVDAQTE